MYRGNAALDGTPPPFELCGLLHFTSMEAMQSALQEAGGEVIADIPKFTNAQPIIQINQPVG